MELKMQQPVPAPPPPPSPPRITVVGGGANPVAVYRAEVAERKELADQQEELQETRQELSERLQDPMVGGADRAGLEARITAIDGRIGALDKQLAIADADVARAAGIPGAVVEDPPEIRQGPPEEFFVLGGIFMVVVMLPLSLAYARRIWRRSATVITSLPQEVIDRLTRLDHAVDSIAVEVERIGEGQRFMTRVLSEKGSAAQGALGAASEQRLPR